MKFSTAAVVSLVATLSAIAPITHAQNTMVKMCLFYPNPSGHARSDPIINQNCASGHVHTFYGPQNFHPNTSYEDIRDTPARFSSSPWVENQSLYWHPTIYEVTDNVDGTKTYTRAPGIDTSPYYRWDNSVLPRTEAFPPGFRMIAHSNDVGANQGGETGANMLTECCDLDGDEDEDCVSWDRLNFPTRTCDFLGIAMAMPTCWNGESLGDDNDHKSHMAYTTDGTVGGPCPAGFDRRLPEVQLFVRIPNYKGGTYQLSDSSDVWHVDFFNGWKEGTLQNIIDNCELDDGGDYGYNPPCGCTPEEGDSRYITENQQVADPVCDVDVRELIIDEATDVTNQLPVGSCEGPTLIPKSWNQISDDLFDCQVTPGGPPPTSLSPTRAPVDTPVTPSPTRSPTTPSPTKAPVEETPEPTQSVEDTPEPTESPFVDEACYDRSLAFRNDERKDCDWVAKRPGRRCGKVWREMALWEYCPVACDVECYDCCEITLYECDETINAVCDRVVEECEAACHEETEDTDECINTICEEEISKCHDNASEKCIATFQACEEFCEA